MSRSIMTCWLLLSVPVLAQEPTPRTLPAPLVESQEGFSAISGLYELPDGRLLISDAREAAVHLLDLRTQVLHPATGQGGGPREFAQAGGLYPMRSGEVWLLDPAQRRYLRFGPNGAPRGTRPFAQTPERMMATSVGRDPHRIDPDAREVTVEMAISPGGIRADSATLVRRAGARTESVTALRLPRIVTRTDLGFRLMNPERFSPEDGYAIAPDARIAVVRAEPYRVEWHGAGRAVVGPVYAFDALQVGDADRDAVRAAPPPRLPPGFVVTAPGSDRPLTAAELRSEPTFASHKPAFHADGVRVARDGRLWVRRHTAHGAPEVHDVFDATGTRVDRVQLAAGTRLVGFGRGAVYTVRVDADDLLYLQRIAMPED